VGACTRDWGVGRPLVPTGRLRPSPETVALQDATRALGPLGDHLIAAWQRSLWRALLGRPPEPVLDGLDDPCRAVVAARPLDPLGLPAVADALRAGVPLGPWLDAARRAARIVLGGAGRPVDGRLGWGPLPR
ncbi:MAG: hypothetical protein N2544_17975, partial [Burkholderiales bacterium]|nr:hypothetical protein [Burkholderiales bacterium]